MLKSCQFLEDGDPTFQSLVISGVTDPEMGVLWTEDISRNDHQAAIQCLGDEL